MVVGNHQAVLRENRPAKHFPEEQPSWRLPFPNVTRLRPSGRFFRFKVNAVRTLPEVDRSMQGGGTRDFLRTIQGLLFAIGDQGIDDFSFINAHRERSRELRFPSDKVSRCRVLPRLSARSGWAKVKALDGAPRKSAGCGTNEGEAECLRGVEARGTLDRP